MIMTQTSLVDTLTIQYREELYNKLPKASLLDPAVLAKYPPGSDVSLVPETCGLLSEEQIRITRLDVTDLIEEISSGKITAFSVMEAFGLRAGIAQQLTCCLTDMWFDEALERAKKLDEEFQKTGKLVGPLHGVPISIKDSFLYPGKVTSLGFLSIHKQGVASETSAQLCDILEAAGAVLYCHTTLPQTIMHLESESFWGRALNPFNTALSPGGSSGGEGALVAMRGSPLGVGTDIGGSIRSPAGNCGLYGLRTTSLRLSLCGTKTYILGRDSILGVGGPIGHSIRDCNLFMNVVCGSEAEAWVAQPSLLEMPWGVGRKGKWEDGERKLRVGVMWDDAEVRPVKPIERALRTAVEKLKASGAVEIVDVKPFKARESWEIIRKLYLGDGARRIHDLLDKSDVGEPLLPLTKWLLEEAGEPVEEITDLHKLWVLNYQRDSFRAAYAAHWNASNIDVLLCPYSGQPASPHGEAKWWSYTSMFNLVDYPCVAFPSGLKVDQELDAVSPEEAAAYQPLSKEDAYLHGMYDVKKYTNAPLSLQLVAAKYHDEEVMAALEVIQKIIQ